MLAKLWKSMVFRIIVVLASIFAIYFFADQLLTYFKKGYIFRVYGQPALILGVAKKLSSDQLVQYSTRVQKSFDVKREGKYSYREAKYEKNVLVDKVNEHIVYATDAYTGENYKLLWTKDSAYACVSKPRVLLKEGMIDPSQEDLKGIKFFFFGQGWRGILGDFGLVQLSFDLNPADPAKLYLVSDQKNSQGDLEVLQLILFTTKPQGCVNTEEVKQIPYKE